MTSEDYELIETKKASCTEEGYRLYINKNNQEEKKEIIPKRNHNWEEVIIRKPTCIETGLKTYVCRNEEDSEYERCYQSQEEKIIPALGHLCKAKNFSRNKNAMRRGAIFTCVHEGCNYEYVLYFQNKEQNTGFDISLPPALLDIDYFDEGQLYYLHFGADMSEAIIEYNREEGILSIS